MVMLSVPLLPAVLVVLVVPVLVLEPVLVVLDDALATDADAAVLVKVFELAPPPHALNVTQARDASVVSRRVGRFINQPLQPDSFNGGCCRGKAQRAQSVAGRRPAALCDVTECTVFAHAFGRCECACRQGF